MFVCASCLGGVRPGEIVIIERDEELNDVSVRPVGGPVMGYVTVVQPEGCLPRGFIEERLGDARALGRVAVKSGDVALIQTDSRVFALPSRGFFASYTGVGV